MPIHITKTSSPSLPRAKRGREKIDSATSHEDPAMRPAKTQSARNKLQWHHLWLCINHPATKGGRGNEAELASGTEEKLPASPCRVLPSLRAFPAARRALRFGGLAEMLLNLMPLDLFRRGANSPRTVKDTSIALYGRLWTAVDCRKLKNMVHACADFILCLSLYSALYTK